MINLTEHRNTLDKRKRKNLRREIEAAARELSRDSEVSEEISGYGIIVWNDEGDASAHWRCGNVPVCLVGEYFKQTMSRIIHKRDAADAIKGE